jgi:hypothetical protein
MSKFNTHSTNNILLRLIISLTIAAIFIICCKHEVVFPPYTNQHHVTLKKGELTDGDIIFQSNTSDYSRAIMMATHSIYSHCGIIFRWQGKYYVYEAIKKISFRPCNDI